MGCGRPLCRRDNGPSSGNPGRPTGQVCAAQVEVRPHNAEWSPGRASHHQISPIKCGLQPIMTAQAGFAVGCPFCYHCRRLGEAIRGIPDKGIAWVDNPFDYMGALELSANDFQMNLATETLHTEDIQD